MVQNQTTNFRSFAAQLLLGSIALARVRRLSAFGNGGLGAALQFVQPLNQEDAS
ncbi:MAG: hypothetical protein QOI88_803 [Gammaproteobacteria bacterium]|nr:hypothetical protein [Gammaproteobacteria bacterium]